jgi:hypothetical protein
MDLELRGRGVGTVNVEATGPRRSKAFDRAAARAARVVHRRLRRGHELRRPPRQRSLLSCGDAEPELLTPAHVGA